MNTDPIADMFVRIKNAQRARLPLVSFPYSRVKQDIAKVLEVHKCVSDIVRKGKKTKRSLELSLVYREGEPKIQEIKRISKPSRRVYMGYKDLRSSQRGNGFYIISTPAGIIDDHKARELKIGGEVLGEVY